MGGTLITTFYRQHILDGRARLATCSLDSGQRANVWQHGDAAWTRPRFPGGRRDICGSIFCSPRRHGGLVFPVSGASAPTLPLQTAQLCKPRQLKWMATPGRDPGHRQGAAAGTAGSAAACPGRLRNRLSVLHVGTWIRQSEGPCFMASLRTRKREHRHERNPDVLIFVINSPAAFDGRAAAGQDVDQERVQA